ncbi:MAG: cupin domain-containing protein [Thermoleophilia bacterium]|nr:cupin domain-containing protein [Thermoleophilia bacterium]
MAEGFKLAGSLTRDEQDWGVFAQISGPRDGLSGIVAIEATFLAGTCHDFHRHPGQEEVIYVIEGTIEQWLGEEMQMLSAGDSVVIAASGVHATFNDGDAPAKILAILSPSVGEDGYGVEDVAGDEPWASLR